MKRFGSPMLLFANMYFIPIGIMLKDVVGVAPEGLNLANLNWAGFLGNNLLPVTIGNIIGGAFFVGILSGTHTSKAKLTKSLFIFFSFFDKQV